MTLRSTIYSTDVELFIVYMGEDAYFQNPVEVVDNGAVRRD